MKRLIRAFRETLGAMTVDPETRELVAGALAEDLGAGDVTADAVVPAESQT